MIKVIKNAIGKLIRLALTKNLTDLIIWITNKFWESRLVIVSKSGLFVFFALNNFLYFNYNIR